MAEQANESESLGKRMRSLRGKARLAAISEVVTRWRESGQSRAAFCREVDIATVTLGRWVRQLEAAEAPRSKGPVLVELDVSERPDRDLFEVVLPSGSRVRVPAGFRAEDLARLLGVLAATC